MSELPIPSLVILEEYLKNGYYIECQYDKCCLFKEWDELFVSGKTLREMLVNLIMADGCDA